MLSEDAGSALSVRSASRAGTTITVARAPGPLHGPMASILTVCPGNVCRSPLIERLLRRSLDDAYGAGAVQVHSAGAGALVD